MILCYKIDRIPVNYDKCLLLYYTPPTYFMKKKRESIILFLYLPQIILNRYGRIHRYSHQSRRYPDRKHHGPIRDLVHSQGYTGH